VDKRRLHVTTNREELVTSFIDIASSGIVAGIEKKGENLHFTYCLDPGGYMNCHIKHNGVTVWQKRQLPEEMARDMVNAVRDSIVTWENNDCVMALNKITLKEINDYLLPKDKEYNLNLIDFVERFLSRFAGEKLVRRRLGRMKKEEAIIGIHERYDDSIFLALPKHVGVVLPFDPEKGIISAIMPLQGLFKYADYAYEHGFFESKVDQAELKDLKHALIEAGFEL